MKYKILAVFIALNLMPLLLVIISRFGDPPIPILEAYITGQILNAFILFIVGVFIGLVYLLEKQAKH